MAGVLVRDRRRSGAASPSAARRRSGRAAGTRRRRTWRLELVFDEFQHRAAGESRDGNTRLEHRLQALVGPPPSALQPSGTGRRRPSGPRSGSASPPLRGSCRRISLRVAAVESLGSCHRRSLLPLSKLRPAGERTLLIVARRRGRHCHRCRPVIGKRQKRERTCPEGRKRPSGKRFSNTRNSACPATGRCRPPGARLTLTSARPWHQPLRAGS